MELARDRRARETPVTARGDGAPQPSATECFDVLGIGFGPANLSLAIALEEDAPSTTALFLEAQTDPVWQSGMLLDGSNIQNHPCRDLVSLRNPRSRYSFLNYLFEEGRLIEHLNLPVEFPLRKEYAQYIQWATRLVGANVELGARVTDIEIEDVAGLPAYVVTLVDGSRRCGRALVFGTGRTALIPAPFDDFDSPRVCHLTQYLQTVRTLTEPPASVAVIGGSQSAVEIVLDLAKRFPEARIVNYIRAYGLRLKDTSPFSEEGYFPAFTDYYFKAPRSSKQTLDAYMRPTNYSSTDADVLHELYTLIYEQRLDGEQRVSVLGNRQVCAVGATEAGLQFDVEELHTGIRTVEEADLVVLATGFRDLGPHPHQEAHPPLLRGVIDRFRFDADGYLIVGPDYSLRPHSDGTPPLYLNGLCESSHGIGDAGSFSLLSLRAAVIRDALRKCVVTPRAAV